MAPAHKFLTLDALRGLAALGVVAWHLGDLAGWLKPSQGYIAVDLFFVMSGFVIAHSYEEKLRNGLSAGAFMSLRLIRLYPYYLLATLFGVAFAIGSGAQSLRADALALSLSLLPTPGLGKAQLLFPYLPVAWSLFLELVANAVYALSWRQWTLRNLVLMCALGALLLIGAALITGHTDLGWTWRNLPGGVARILFGFPMGVLLYRLHRAGRLRLRSHAGLCGLATLVLLYAHPSGGLALPWELFSILVLAPAIAAFAICAEPRPFWSKPCLALGAASYGLYLLHFPLTKMLQARFPESAGALSPAWIALFAAAAFALAYAVHRLADEPVRGALMRRYRARRAAKAGLAPQA